MDALESLGTDPWYAINCEAHHALLGASFSLALLAAYFLIYLIMEYFFRGETRITPFSFSAWPWLVLLSSGLGLISHYLGDFGYIAGWRW